MRLTMRSVALALSVAALLAGMPAPAAAQTEARPQLQLERKQKKTVVQPAPDVARAQRDVDDAAVALEERRRGEASIKEQLEGRPRRPELDESVSGAIQSERLRRAPKAPR